MANLLIYSSGSFCFMCANNATTSFTFVHTHTHINIYIHTRIKKK
jgi:hypothetical protein